MLLCARRRGLWERGRGLGSPFPSSNIITSSVIAAGTEAGFVGTGEGSGDGRSPFPSSNIITSSVIAAGASGLLKPTPVPIMFAKIYFLFHCL